MSPCLSQGPSLPRLSILELQARGGNAAPLRAPLPEPDSVVIWEEFATLPLPLPPPPPPYNLAVKYQTFSQTIPFAPDCTVVKYLQKLPANLAQGGKEYTVHSKNKQYTHLAGSL